MPARHVVVDGSNMATEGSSLPSLKQLDEAVREFLIENPDDIVTVVVDATFGHRIPPEERKRFEQAESAGEIVSPPAGAIGRGDAFLLRVADKVGAVVLSNDSFQEFHGEYEWLFDKGRLIGGKPVPGVGWIFTPRTPVRGPKSRESVKEAKRKRHAEKVEEPSESGLDMAAERSRGHGGDRKLQRAIAAAVEEAVEPAKGGHKRRRRRRGGEVPSEPLNEPFNFITFIAAHQLGDEVEGTVDEFASHGAFISVDGARCYLPLSAMGDVPPRSAREVLRKAERRVFVVQAFDAMRRGIELALPGFARLAGTPTAETIDAEIHRGEAGQEAVGHEAVVEAFPPVVVVGDGSGTAVSGPPVAKRTRKAVVAGEGAGKAVGGQKRAPAKAGATAAKATRPSQRTAAAKAGAQKAAAPNVPVANEPAAREPAGKEPAGKKSPAKKATPGKTVPGELGHGKLGPEKSGPEKRAPGKTVPEKSVLGTSGAKKAAITKTGATKTAATKSTAKKAPAQNQPAQDQPAKNQPVKKTGTANAAPVAASTSKTQEQARPPAATARAAGGKSPAKKQPAQKLPTAATVAAARATKSPAPKQARVARAATGGSSSVSGSAGATGAPGKKSPSPGAAPEKKASTARRSSANTRGKPTSA